MSPRNRKGTCAYCGKQRTLTRDHVPPRILFSKPCPSAMLTVPACEECNKSFKNDDEYTAMVLALDIRAATHRDVIGNLSAMMRRLQYPKGRGFTEYLGAQTRLSPILGTNGLPVRRLTRDPNRLAATGKRLVRGLHYVETRKPLTPDTPITMSMCDDREPPTELLIYAVQAYDASKERRHREVGSAFSYAVGFDDDGRSVWVIMVYGYFFWFATVGEP
jgi:hypothetical protein